MSLTNAYEQVLKESSSAVAGDSKKPGKPYFGGETPKDVIDSRENVEGLEEPKKGPSQTDKEGEPKPLKTKHESLNPFDVLYNKVLAQENWEAEEEAGEEMGGPENLDLSFSGDTESGEGEIGADEEGEEGEDSGDPMVQVLDALKAAVAALEKVVGGEEEGEDEEDLDFEGEGDSEGADEGAEDEEEEESPFAGLNQESTEEDSDEDEDEDSEEVKEEVDMEELGTALLDIEKLAASLMNPKSQVVKGAVPVAKGKAQVPKGAKVDGKPSELGDKSDTLQSKKQDTGYVKKGKAWLDQ
jgi:hypothetical protein